MVDPVGETPHGAVNLAKLHRRGRVVFHGIDEIIVKVAIVQEDIRVVPPPIEMSLDRLKRLNDAVQFLVPRQYDKGSICARAFRPVRVDWETAGCEDFIVLFADFSVSQIRSVTTDDDHKEEETNRIEGGVPAGIKIPPGDEGCRTKRSRIKTITRHGNSKTNPRGIEIDELPFNLILRRKKANLGRA